MQPMRIVLPGALPGPTIAAELLSHLPAAAPRLIKWLENSQATHVAADPEQTRCTPLEAWQLRASDYQAQSGQVRGAGLGPFLANGHITDDKPVWLLELVHLAAAREGAILQPARTLAITAEESQALYDTASALFTDTDFKLEPLATTHWRVHLPDGYQPACASPELVSLGNVTDWWEQDVNGRAWRRLANELQMAWFDHAVNQSRAEQGQTPINGVWLFGGGRRSQLGQPASRADAQIDTSLLQAWRTADWGSWLTALKQLDETVFASFGAQAQPELVLAGHDDFVVLKPGKSLWQRLQPNHRNKWKKWWSNPQ